MIKINIDKLPDKSCNATTKDEVRQAIQHGSPKIEYRYKTIAIVSFGSFVEWLCIPNEAIT